MAPAREVLRKECSLQKMDLGRLHQTFFQESLEEIGIIERSLLALKGKENSEVIGETLSSVHSIKGGSTTCGFADIAEFAGLLDTILSLMSDGGAMPYGLTIDALLHAMDSLRELAMARLEKREPDSTLMQTATSELISTLANARVDDGRKQTEQVAEEVAEAGAGDTGTGDQISCEQPIECTATEKFGKPNLHVRFVPHSGLFVTGNDPLSYLSSFDGLGACTNMVDLSKIPALTALDTQTCYLAWNLTLISPTADASVVREVFDWISDECDLEITEYAGLSEAIAQPIELPVKAEIWIDCKRESVTDSDSMRVATKKVDALVNLVGELVITQSMLSCLGEEFDLSQLDKLRRGVAQLTVHTRGLQETVLQIRMLPVDHLFQRLSRSIEKLSHEMGKPTRVEVSGTKTELDRSVLEGLEGPMMHLARNSLENSFEAAESRRQAGKPAEGVLRLHAEYRGGNVVIEICDDGAGLDERSMSASSDVPGFAGGDGTLRTPAAQVEELGGKLEKTRRPGEGTTNRIQLPLTLAILEGQLMRVGSQRFVVPLVAIVESLRIEKPALYRVASGMYVYRLRDEYLPIVNLNKLLNLDCSERQIEQCLLVVVESRGIRLALQVDDLLAQQQVVIKNLETNFYKVDGIAGATILGDGSIAMILDIAGVVDWFQGLSTRDVDKQAAVKFSIPSSIQEGGHPHERIDARLC